MIKIIYFAKLKTKIVLLLENNSVFQYLHELTLNNKIDFIHFIHINYLYK